MHGASRGPRCAVVALGLMLGTSAVRGELPAGEPVPVTTAPAAADRGRVEEIGGWVRVSLPWDPVAGKALDRILTTGRERLEAGAIAGEPSYEGSFLVWDTMTADLEAVGNFASWDFYTSPDPAAREAGEKTEELVGKLGTVLTTLRRPYEILKAAFDRMGSRLEGEARVYAADVLREFETNGVHLEGEARERLRALDVRLIEISTGLARVWKDREVRLPVPAAVAAHLDPAQLADEGEGEGERVFVLREDSYADALRRHPDRVFRERVYREFFTSTADLVPELDRLRRLRQERARLTGAAGYVERELEDEGFTPERVRGALGELTRETEVRYRATLEDYRALMGGADPRPWDLNWLEETAPTGGVDPSVFLEYFTVERTMTTLLELARGLFGLTFEKNGEEAKTRVGRYQVRDRDGRIIGRFMLDLFPRPNKYSHAACWTMQGRSRRHPDRQAVQGLVANVHERPLDGGATGIVLDEAQTIFHEFGHVLHGYLIHSEALGAHHVPASLVEVPSQVFESWMLDPAVLDRLARHHATGAGLPPPLREALYQKAGRFAARHVRSQVLYARFDLDFHDRPEEPAQDLWNRLAAELFGEGFYPADVPWFSRFDHLDGYGAKYWGYKFADLGKAQVYWHLVHRYRDLTGAQAGRHLEDAVFRSGGLRKLPAVAVGATGRELTALPYVLETLVTYPELRSAIEAAAGDGLDFPASLARARGLLLGAPGSGGPAPER